MELLFTEKQLLILYLELFNRCYDTNDKRKYNDNSGILVKHTEMQNIYYLFQNLGIDYNDFGFSRNWHGPYSAGLQSLLNKLDKKGEYINDFYKSYIEKKPLSNNYKNQLQISLSSYFTEDQINKVVITSYLFKDLLNKKMGSEAIAEIIYLYNVVLPESDFSIIINELENRGYHFDYELVNEVWKNLTMLGIIKMRPKNVKIKVKAIK